MKFVELVNGSGAQIKTQKATRESVAGFSFEFCGWRVSVERHPGAAPSPEEQKPIKIGVMLPVAPTALPEPPTKPGTQLNLPPVSGPAEYPYWIEDGQDYCAQW